MKKMAGLALIALIALIAGCAQTAPTVQQGPDAEVTFDGLVRVDNARFNDVWIDPDIDFSRYNKVMVGEAAFEFRAVRKNASTHSRTSSDTMFWMNDEQRERLIDTVTGVFREEIKNSVNFTQTDTPGDDVLVIVGGLHDIISRVPPDMIGRSEIFLASVGEATLVIEARDSLSGETIYRALDRRAAERVGGQAIRSNTVTNTSEVRRLAQGWAIRLREGLDSIHE